MGHVLQMVVHLVFHVEDNALGNPGVNITLQHRDDLGSRQRNKSRQQQAHQQRQILSHQRLVHNFPGDDAGQQPQHR